MRTPFLHLLPIVCLLGALVSGSPNAQEPTPAPAPDAAPPAPATAPDAAPEPEAAPAPRPNRRPRRPAMVIEAGTLHPVAGPAIADGVVVIRGERIVAIGKRGEVEVPPNAVVRSFPTGHVYPGLVDAATDAFTDASVRSDGGLDAADALADVLQRRHDREDELARVGITTAYVTAASPSLLGGQGAIVRPTKDGFELWQGHERAAVQLRLTGGPNPGHPLQRQQQYDAANALFEGLDEYRKARTDHAEALTKYQKEFDEYLTWHRNKNKKDGDKPADKDAKAEAQPAAPATEPPQPAGPPEGGRRRRGGGPPRDGAAEPAAGEVEAALAALFGAAPQDQPKQDPPAGKPAPAPAGQGPEGQGDAAKKPADDKKDAGPKRPTYPKAPPPNPQKDVLLRVIDGELPLRVEAHRADELRAALQLQDERRIPVMVLERAYAAGRVADRLAERGIAAVLTDVLPASLPKAYEDFDATTLPAHLQRAGVAFAIASGSGRRAGVLPLMAATAIGGGLAEEAALRAITLTPAEILGVAADTGSLAVGKYGDVLVCDRPLFQSDSRVLLVLGKGRAEFEAN
ncbi:MAG: amidohydrolase family protein [Planctomycetes bacterium]|nr:amidohydrolase family protein [Planctomycetota bacterium]